MSSATATNVAKRLLLPCAAFVSVAAMAANVVPSLPGPAARQPGDQPLAVPARPEPARPRFDPLWGAIMEWKRLRQSDSLLFSDYARFLVAHPGWPGEAALRRTAERRLDSAGGSGEIVPFFMRFPPLTTVGKARFAEALAATGRTADARTAAADAWVAGALPPDVEARMLARFSAVLTPALHDRRMEQLLWDRATTAAGRQIVWTSALRRPVYEARLAMQLNQPDAAAKVAGAGAGAERDAGFVADRAMWMRDTGQGSVARAWLAQPRTFDQPPFDAKEWLKTLLVFARASANDGQWGYAFDIARLADTAFPTGTDVRTRSLGERDDYTSLVWLGGIAALERLNRPRDALIMFNRYAQAAQSPQTQSKGWYWAGRAAQAAGDTVAANGFYKQAAVHVDQFYGQLAAERVGQAIAMPPEPLMVAIPPEQRAAFANSEIVRAARLLGGTGEWQDQTQFIRTIAQNAKTDADHVLAGELANLIGRPDLGVMVSRFARNSGARDPVRIGFPQLSVPGPYENLWVMIHAITRQESQFDRTATSRVGAKGLMQLMPGTAREQAGKLGLPYDYDRLTSDPPYNITLGAAFFQRMLDYYGGSHVLAVASYNAGPGNVNKWLAANGDPRVPGVDVVDWIEAIPLSETRGYVQRVLENAVVYDMLHPQRARMPAQNRLSAYLGKRTVG
jgi:soluble lytic murein transglycosylase